MKKTLSILIGSAAAAIALTACDAPAPKTAPAPPAQPTAAPPGPPGGDSAVDRARSDLADILRDRDSYSRARRLGTLVPTLGPEAVPAIRPTLEDLRLDPRGLEYELLLRFWATHQPEAASLWARDNSPGSYREAAMYASLRTWAELDPQTASQTSWKWLDTPDALIQIIVPIALVRGWYENGDIEGLRKFLASNPPDIPGQRAITNYIKITVENEGTAPVMAWAESLPDDDKTYKLTVFRRVSDSLAKIEPDAATRWCEAHCSGPYGNNMRSLIARHWVLRDGPGALAWLSTAPDGHEKNLALRLTFAQWSRMQREEAMAWMASQVASGEPAAWLQPLYPVYARLLSGESPTEAIRWASAIQNQKEREHVLIGVARVWRHLDEAAAENWLATSPLSEEQRAKAREPASAPLNVPGGAS